HGKDVVPGAEGIERIGKAEKRPLPVAAPDLAGVSEPLPHGLRRILVAVRLTQDRIGEVVKRSERGGRLVMLERDLEGMAEQHRALVSASLGDEEERLRVQRLGEDLR